MLRLGLAIGGAVLLALIVAVVVHVRRTVVPPGCRDPRTLAVVHTTLVEHFRLPANVRLERIKVLAGGPLAFRFVCQADLEGFDPHALPPGPRPGYVHYTTQLMGTDRKLDVTIRVLPLMIMVPVQ